MSEIGKALKSARIEKGYTLDDLQQITKIQKKYLIAIEEEDFSVLPGDFYVRAFIKQYAETVGLDSAVLLNQLKPKVKPADEPEMTRAKTKNDKANFQRTDRFNHFLSLLPTIIIVVVVVVILGSIYAVAWNNHRKNSSTQQIESSKVSVSSSKNSSKRSKNSSAVSKSNSKKTSSTKKNTKKQTTEQKIKLSSNSGSSFIYELTLSKQQKSSIVVAASDKSWTAVSIDGSQQWQGTLASGQSHTVAVPASATKITFNLGNSKATEIKINGKKFNFLNDNDSLTVRTITVNVQSQADD
jgi:cytoskeletal protein RodZ